MLLVYRVLVPMLYDSKPFQQITVHYCLILKLIVCGTRSDCTSQPYLTNTGDKWIIKAESSITSVPCTSEWNSEAATLIKMK